MQNVLSYYLKFLQNPLNNRLTWISVEDMTP